VFVVSAPHPVPAATAAIQKPTKEPASMKKPAAPPKCDAPFTASMPKDKVPRASFGQSDRKPGSKLKFICLGGGVAMVGLVALVGAFVYPGFLNSTSFRHNGDQHSNKGKSENPAIEVPSTNPLLAYLPADSQIIYGVKPSTPFFKRLVERAYQRAFPVNPKDIPEPAAIIVAQNPRRVSVFQLAEPFDRDKIRNLTKAQQFPGMDLFLMRNHGCVGMPNNRVIVASDLNWDVKEFGDVLVSQQLTLDPELRTQIGAVEKSNLWAVATNNGGMIGTEIKDPQMDGITKFQAAMQRTRFARLAVNLPPSGGVEAKVDLVCANDVDAKQLFDMGENFWIDHGARNLKRLASEANIGAEDWIRDSAGTLSLNNANLLTLTLRFSDRTLRTVESTITRENNLKQIVAAMWGYNTAHKRFPPAGSTDPKGKPLLSWRVHILPYIGEKGLYDQFDLNSAWNDPKNLALLERIPEIYLLPGRNAAPGETHYQVFTADKDEPIASRPIFSLGRSLMVSDLRDGTVNTLMVAEGEKAVPWTKPADLHYSAKLPIPRIGDPATPWFIVAMADGQLVKVQRSVAQTDLRRAIETNDRQPPLPDGWEHGTARR